MDIDLSAVVQSAQILLRKNDMIANNLANINTAGFKRDDGFYNEVQSSGILPPGEYTLRAFSDENGNTFWDSGSWGEKRQPEEMHYYFENITVRENWNLELEWIIEE